MAAYQKATNEMVTCPFDSAHRMLKSRLQMHITKCKLNHLDKQMVVCPFNATHQMEQGLVNDHLIKCPDRFPLDKYMASSLDKNNIFKGRTAVPSYHQAAVPCEESWDVSSSPTAGYMPQAAPPKDGIVLDLGLMKPAERKSYYRSLHTMGGSSDDKDVSGNGTKKIEEPYRRPLQTHEVLMLDKKTASSNPCVGLGRGNPRADSRIAADIFGGETQSLRQPRSFRQLVSGMNNLNVGIGRGRGQIIDISSDVEFPSLGAARAPKVISQQSLRTDRPSSSSSED